MDSKNNSIATTQKSVWLSQIRDIFRIILVGHLNAYLSAIFQKMNPYDQIRF
jgi:hypothetical protein